MVCAICGRMPLIEAIGTHESRRRNRFQQMLRHQGIHHGNAGNIDNGEVERVFNDCIEQILHDHLRTRTVKSANQRQRQNVVPQANHGGGKFQQFLLLADDDFLARFLIRPPW